MQPTLVILVSAGLGAAMGWGLFSSSMGASRWVLTLTCAVLCGSVAWWYIGSSPALPEDRPTTSALPDIELARLNPARPIQVNEGEFVSSTSCRECHPAKHATWDKSYHSKMTQVATPDAIIPEYDGTEVAVQGRTYRFRRSRDVCWVEMDDLGNPTGGRIEVPLVMTTGSHHMQVYWYPTAHTRMLGQLPLVFLRETEEWIPRRSAFLVAPSEFQPETGRWNETCIGCHATQGQPRPDGQGGWDSRVAEFGIACEACHGPGRDHVTSHRLAGAEPGVVNRLVNPAELDNRRASQVCGQCHSVNVPLDMRRFVAAQYEGKDFRPGGDLHESVHVVRESPESRQHLAKVFDDVDQFMLDQFWSDGMVRISGREYNGLIESACHEQGQMSCLSCHRLHQEEDDQRTQLDWANDQLAEGMRTDAACTQCHEADRYGQEHTHHAPSSAGASCYNCHMPHTTYGLLKAIRSHQISSPNAQVELETGRPNACNQCHIDRSLGWTASYLKEWYDQQIPRMDSQLEETSATLLAALRGDAGQRALAAWSMGWDAAQQTSGNNWQAPFLAYLLDDPYDAVRFIAARSLRSLPGFEDLEYDFVAAPAERQRVQQRVRERFRTSDSPLDRPALLIDSGSVLIDRVEQILRDRDDRPVNLAE